MREFKKEGSKKNTMSKAVSQGSENTRWYEAERERESVCVCMVMGWLCVSCSILLAGESGRDENEIGRGENAMQPVALRGPAWETLVESWPGVASSSQCCTQIFISGLVTINNLD